MTTKTTIFGALLAIIALTMGSIATNAYADTTTTDPTVTRYLESIISDNDGKITHSFEDYSVITKVKEIGNDKYKVKTQVYENNKLVDNIVYTIQKDTALDQLTINVNGKETVFQNEKRFGASIESIYPGYYLTTVDVKSSNVYIPSNGAYNFSASDGACHGADYDVFGVIFGYNGYANFTWAVDNYHWYYCVIPQFLQLGVVNYNGSYGTSLGAGDTTGSWSGYVSTPGTYQLRGTFNYVLP